MILINDFALVSLFFIWIFVGDFNLPPLVSRDYRKYGIKYFAYAVYKVQVGLRFIYQDYRKRFGIETSYRVKNQCSIKTTTKNPLVRLLFYGIAFILTDMWVYLTWTYLSLARKGGRQLFYDLLPPKTHADIPTSIN